MSFNRNASVEFDERFPAIPIANGDWIRIRSSRSQYQYYLIRIRKNKIIKMRPWNDMPNLEVWPKPSYFINWNACYPTSVYIRDAQSFLSKARFNPDIVVSAITVSHDGKKIYVHARDGGRIQVWNSANLNKIKKIDEFVCEKTPMVSSMVADRDRLFVAYQHYKNQYLDRSVIAEYNLKTKILTKEYLLRRHIRPTKLIVLDDYLIFDHYYDEEPLTVIHIMDFKLNMFIDEVLMPNHDTWALSHQLKFISSGDATYESSFLNDYFCYVFDRANELYKVLNTIFLRDEITSVIRSFLKPERRIDSRAPELGTFEAEDIHWKARVTKIPLYKAPSSLGDFDFRDPSYFFRSPEDEWIGVTSFNRNDFLISCKEQVLTRQKCVTTLFQSGGFDNYLAMVPAKAAFLHAQHDYYTVDPNSTYYASERTSTVYLRDFNFSCMGQCQVDCRVSCMTSSPDGNRAYLKGKDQYSVAEWDISDPHHIKKSNDDFPLVNGWNITGIIANDKYLFAFGNQENDYPWPVDIFIYDLSTKQCVSQFNIGVRNNERNRDDDVVVYNYPNRLILLNDLLAVNNRTGISIFKIDGTQLHYFDDVPIPEHQQGRIDFDLTSDLKILSRTGLVWETEFLNEYYVYQLCIKNNFLADLLQKNSSNGAHSIPKEVSSIIIGFFKPVRKTPKSMMHLAEEIFIHRAVKPRHS